MATVCGASLSLMDAGVPLPRPVAGIAMGLIKEQDDFVVLSDILGDEDHLGDMDFKVAGTERGVTALQMDIKITSITEAIMRTALDQARDGRIHILGEMAQGISSARDALSQMAPRITVIHINKDKIREVIGPGGKVIREICEVTGARVDLEDDGTVKIAAVDQRAADAAIEWIRSIAAEPEVGVDLHRQGGQDRRLRRLRELPGQSRRPRAHQRARPRAGRQGLRRRAGRRSASRSS